MSLGPDGSGRAAVVLDVGFCCASVLYDCVWVLGSSVRTVMQVRDLLTLMAFNQHNPLLCVTHTHTRALPCNNMCVHGSLGKAVDPV